jgi:hypothetical protein
MIRYAIINTSTNIVENVILWDGVSDWIPPENHIAVNAEDTIVGPKWIYNKNGSFTAPEPVADPEPPAAPTLAELQAQLTALQTQISLLHT